MTQSQLYIELVKSTGFKKGDKVKVTHKVPSHHLGWSYLWLEAMDRLVGKECTISGLCEQGVYLKEDPVAHAYPIYCLELLRKGYEIQKVKLSDKYTAEIESNGTVVVGCQRIPVDTFRRIQDCVDAALANKAMEDLDQLFYKAQYSDEQIKNITSPGYRFLKLGEVILKTDEYYNNAKFSWVTVTNLCRVGDMPFMIYRRKITVENNNNP